MISICMISASVVGSVSMAPPSRVTRLVELDPLIEAGDQTFTTPVSRCKQRVGGHDISLWVAGRQWLVTRLLASARALQRYLGVVMKCLRP